MNVRFDWNLPFASSPGKGRSWPNYEVLKPRSAGFSVFGEGPVLV